MITNLKKLTIVNPNYIACLMWKDQYGRTYRYQLWSGVGETVPLGFPLYNGQQIKKNFRIEIWSLSGANVTETVGQNLIMSVLQAIDYRYANDTSLNNGDGLITNFAAQAGVPDNYPVNANLQARWLGSTVVTGQGWVSSDVFLRNITGVNAITNTSIAKTNVGVVTAPSFVFPVSGASITPNHTFMVCYVVGTPGGTSLLYKYNDINVLAYLTAGPAGFATITLEDGNAINIPINTWVIVETGYQGSVGHVQSFVRYLPLSTSVYMIPAMIASATVVTASNSGFSLAGNGGNFYVADIEVFSFYLGQAGSQQILTYFNNRYNFNFTLPLTFPANSTPQPNTI